MLHEFIALHRGAIENQVREQGRARNRSSIAWDELAPGLSALLGQLSDALWQEANGTPPASEALGRLAARQGAAMEASGFDPPQVVEAYGDVCQAITTVALDEQVPITVGEFGALNRSLDVVTAEAVAEHTRVSDDRRAEQEIWRRGQAAHEIRNLLNGSILAFQALRRGAAAVDGEMGAVLGRSLTNLRTLVERTLSEVRLGAGRQQEERLAVALLIEEMAGAGVLLSDYWDIRFVVAPVDPMLAVDADPQLLSSAVMNLVHNAFKHTRPGGTVVLSAHAENERLLVHVQDECGGIPASKGDLFRPLAERRGRDRSGLGLGLSIARQAARTYGGDIRVRNVPGKGCIFTIDMPLARQLRAVPQTI